MQSSRKDWGSEYRLGRMPPKAFIHSIFDVEDKIAAYVPFFWVGRITGADYYRSQTIFDKPWIEYLDKIVLASQDVFCSANLAFCFHHRSTLLRNWPFVSDTPFPMHPDIFNRPSNRKRR